MSLVGVLNRPTRLGRLWRGAYEIGYGILKAFTWMAFRPLFGVHRLGPPPAWPTGGFLLCANHTSYLDPAFLQLVVPRRVTFVMTNDFYVIPWGRWFFALVGAVPMGPGRLGHRGLRRAAALLKRGHVVALFPEGRLSRDGTPGEPQRGVGYLARRTGVPVVPVAITGAFEVWPRGARWFRQSRVRLLFGSPRRWERPPGSPPTPREAREPERRMAQALMDDVRALRTRLLAEPDNRPSAAKFHVHRHGHGS